MPIAAPQNPTEDDLKAIARFILQTAYSDGVGSLTLERSEDGFKGRFSDRTDPKKILQYDLSKSEGGWQLSYKALSGVEDIESGSDFSETETEPIWNETPFAFAESKIRTGTTVSWKWQSGTATGKVIKIYRFRITLKLGDTEVTRNGTEDNPAILIEQKNKARALKLVSEVRVVSSEYAEAEDEKDPADLYAEQAIAAAAPIFTSWLSQIESSLFDNATSLEEIRDRVEATYSDLDAADFAEVMQSLLFSGYLSGRYQVIEETKED